MRKGFWRLAFAVCVVAVGILGTGAASASASAGMVCNVSPSALKFSPGLSDASPAVQTIKIKGSYNSCTGGSGEGAGITSGKFSTSFTTIGPYTCTSMLNASGVVAIGTETVKWKPGKLTTNLEVEIGTFGAVSHVSSGFSEAEGFLVGGQLSGYSEPKFAGSGEPCLGKKLKSVNVTFTPVWFY